MMGIGDCLVLMVTPGTGEEEMRRLETCLSAVTFRGPVLSAPPTPGKPEPVMRPREAILAPYEVVPAEESLGRILAAPGVSCPPAVPVVLCGERIDTAAVNMFRYYGIRTCEVVREAAGKAAPDA